jgi:HEAT repeat protein
MLMPLVRRGSTGESTGGGEEIETGSPIQALASPDDDRRWHAARALASRPDAVSTLAEAIAGERVPRVREAMITALMRIGGEASVRALLPCLRSRDAGLRAAAVEALQAMPAAAAPFVAALFADADSDVRLLATEIVRGMPAPEATANLCRLIESEPHPNVCAAAIEVLSEVGTPDCIVTLRRCAERFAGTPFVPFAASVAVARITGTKG